MISVSTGLIFACFVVRYYFGTFFNIVRVAKAAVASIIIFYLMQLLPKYPVELVPLVCIIAAIVFILFVLVFDGAFRNEFKRIISISSRRVDSKSRFKKS